MNEKTSKSETMPTTSSKDETMPTTSKEDFIWVKHPDSSQGYNEQIPTTLCTCKKKSTYIAHQLK